MVGQNIVFPKALYTAAHRFADKPTFVGEIIVTLVEDDGEKYGKLTELQKYIVDECLDELHERAKSRARGREQKAKQRAAKKGAK